MAEIKEVAHTYYIPDNFIEEGRIMQGRYKLRNVIEGGILGAVFGLIGALIVLSIPDLTVQVKVTILSVCIVPPFVLGVIGFNGDTIFTTLKAASSWLKAKDTMLYNQKSRLLKRDPLLTVINETTTRDAILDNIEERRQENIRKKAELDLRVGKDFTFREDEYIDAYTKRNRKSVAESKGKIEKEYLFESHKQTNSSGHVYNPDEELDIDLSSPLNSNDGIGKIERIGQTPITPSKTPEIELDFDEEDLDV